VNNILITNDKTNRQFVPIDSKLFNKLKEEFERKGGLIQQNEETDEHLDRRNAEGAALNGYTILLKRLPSISAVYEELIHAEQFRENKNNGSVEQRLLCEIEAQEILIKNKEKWNIPDIENEQTVRALEQYKNDLDQYYKYAGG